MLPVVALAYLNIHDIKIGEFIIPKGSEYYENDYGEIVSSDIIFKGFVNLKELNHELASET